MKVDLYTGHLIAARAKAPRVKPGNKDIILGYKVLKYSEATQEEKEKYEFAEVYFPPTMLPFVDNEPTALVPLDEGDERMREENMRYHDEETLKELYKWGGQYALRFAEENGLDYSGLRLCRGNDQCHVDMKTVYKYYLNDEAETVIQVPPGEKILNVGYDAAGRKSQKSASQSSENG